MEGQSWTPDPPRLCSCLMPSWLSLGNGCRGRLRPWLPAVTDASMGFGFREQNSGPRGSTAAGHPPLGGALPLTSGHRPQQPGCPSRPEPCSPPSTASPNSATPKRGKCGASAEPSGSHCSSVKWADASTCTGWGSGTYRRVLPHRCSSGDEVTATAAPPPGYDCSLETYIPSHLNPHPK